MTYGGSISLSLLGLAFAFLNMILAIADRVAQRKLLTTSCKDLSTETCVLLNNLLGCIPTALIGYRLGEVEHFNSALWFQSSATSFMVLQNSARMCVVVAGILIFGDRVDSL